MGKKSSRKPRPADSKAEIREERHVDGDAPHAAICVLGMHRSGTSMVAALLEKCGVHLGPQDELVPADEHNTRGYFEHPGFVKINDALLAHFHGSWDEPPPLPPSWQYDPGLEALAADARALLRGLANGTPCFGWKDPRTTILLPFWKTLVEHVRFVVCVRNPLEVVRSLARRDRMPARRAAHLWETYTLSAIRETKGMPRIFVFYEDLLAQPAAEIRRIAAFCGLVEPDDASLLGRRVIDPKLRHGAATVEALLRSDDFTSAQHLLYVGLRAVDRDNAERASATIDALDHVYRRLHDQSVLVRVDTALANRERQVDALQRAAHQHELAQLRRDEHVSQLIENDRALLEELRALRSALQAQRDEVADLTAARNFLAAELARLRSERPSSTDDPD